MAYLLKWDVTITHQLAPEYYCLGIFQEVIEGSNWLILKAFYNGTGNDLPITFPGKHYYYTRPKRSDVTVTGSWGVFLGLYNLQKRLFASWSAMNNNIGEISFLANPNVMSFDGITF